MSPFTSEQLEQIEGAVRRVLVARVESPWLDTEAAAAYLGTTPGTLKNWRATAKGPKYRVVQDRLVRYHRDDLDAFVRG